MLARPVHELVSEHMHRTERRWAFAVTSTVPSGRNTQTSINSGRLLDDVWSNLNWISVVFLLKIGTFLLFTRIAFLIEMPLKKIMFSCSTIEHSSTPLYSFCIWKKNKKHHLKCHMSSRHIGGAGHRASPRENPRLWQNPGQKNMHQKNYLGQTRRRKITRQIYTHRILRNDAPVPGIDSGIHTACFVMRGLFFVNVVFTGVCTSWCVKAVLLHTNTVTNSRLQTIRNTNL